MRSVAVALALLTSLAACAPGASSGMHNSTFSRSPSASKGPLQARLTTTFGDEIGFELNRAAYTAVFVVEPGSGVRMIYPTFSGETKRLAAGSHRFDRGLLARRRGAFAGSYGDPWGAFGGYDTYRSGFTSSSSFASSFGTLARPRYFLLISSLVPLRAPELMNNYGMLQQALGRGRVTSANAYSLMEDIAGLVLTNPTPGTYATDVSVDWRSASVQRSAVAYRAIPCSGGGAIVVPWYASVRQCPGDQRAYKAPPVSGEPADTATVRKPGRRPPLPADTGAASGTRGALISRLREFRPAVDELRTRDPALRVERRAEPRAADEPKVERPEPTRATPTEPREPQRQRPEPREPERRAPQPERAEPRPTPQSSPRPESRPETQSAPAPRPSAGDRRPGVLQR